MKRDMDLVRKILIAMEAHPHGFAPHPLTIDGYDEETIGYHVHLMDQGRLLEAVKTTALGDAGPNALPVTLTWEGHEFLASAHDSVLWDRAMAVAKKAGSSSLTVLMDVLTKLALHQVGLLIPKP